MKYIEAYQTTDRFDFYRAAEYLAANNIEFQKLYEYRLHAETNFGSEGYPAILSVKEKDASKANDLLIEGGFLNTYSNQGNNVNILQDQSILENDVFKNEIQSIRGNNIKDVFYIFANEFEYDLDFIHSVDFAIVIRFSNDEYMSWSFKEEEVDFENDIYIPQCFDLRFSNILPEIDRNYKIENLTHNKYWEQLLKEPINDIRIYAQEFEENKVFTDLIIKTRTKTVAIYSAEEPTENEEQFEVSLSIGNSWTIVVFDEETIKISERIKEN
ncbi:MAG: hypothetical protein ACKV1O_17855 [Saprospiraceae bacterium]